MNKLYKSKVERGFRSSLSAVSFRKLMETSRVLFEDTNSPTSLALWLMLEAKEYEQYLNFNIDPQNYLCVTDFRNDYQCAKLFSKYELFPKVYDTKRKAEESFINCEAKCRSINGAIQEYGFSSLLKTSAVNEVVHFAMRKISQILGPAPELNDLHFSFGPGLNVGLSNNNTSVTDKLTVRPTATKPLLTFLKENPLDHPAWDSLISNSEVIPSIPVSPISRCDEVSGSKLSFVPKNAKTDRPICIEPLYNSYVQSGIGNAIRKRLLKSGCNLKDQTRNQELARLGSLDGSLATVDLSNASDTISYMVVLNLLPLPWFSLLDLARSPSFTYEGRTYPLEKISSMGNGFTFELESLIFLSLARAVCQVLHLPQGQVNTYGDDIIIPTAGYELLSEVLTSLGFSVNQEKSFRTGPFRESCGSDWFLGVQVRPLFLKKKPTPATVMYWCNHLRRQGGPYEKDPTVARFWASLKSLVPPVFHKLEGPDGQGDGHFVVPLSEYKGNRVHSLRRRGWEGYGYFTIQDRPIQFRTDGRANYATALYNAQSSSDSPQSYFPRHWEGATQRRNRTDRKSVV